MAKKILSFQEYSETIKADAKNEISEEENEECPCGTDEEGNCLECEEGTESPEEESDEEESDGDDGDDDDDDESDDDDDDDDEEDEEDESDEEDVESDEVEEAPESDAPAETPVTVEEMLTEAHHKIKEAACEYEKDAYQDHTLEMYMKENAALVATLAAKAMEEGYDEVKETEMTQEMFEAICNEMKESYGKKMDELKETYGAGKE